MYTRPQLLEAIDYWSKILEQKTAEDKAKQRRQLAARKRIENNIRLKRSQRQPILNKINQMQELIPFASVPGQPKIVLIDQRPVVLVNFGTIVIPMYCSTGYAGKSAKTAKAGKWYIFFGLGDDWWFNKTIVFPPEYDEHRKLLNPGISMINQFSCQDCQAFAQKLNKTIGNIVGIFNDETPIDLQNEKYKNLARNDINNCFKFKPINGGESNTPEISYRYVLNLLDAKLNTCTHTSDSLLILLTFRDLGYKFKAEDLRKIGNRNDARQCFNEETINEYAVDGVKTKKTNDDWFDDIMKMSPEELEKDSDVDDDLDSFLAGTRYDRRKK